VVSLAFDSVSLTYEGSDRTVRALDALDLVVAQGEPVAVIGPSGCGKSTLLLLAAGLLTPNSGAVRVAAQREGAGSGSATTAEPLAGPRRETALILQDFGLLPWKTVEANAGLGLQVRGVPREERRRRSAEALERVGLGDFAHAYPAELSGGMRQRLALARAVALDADLLLMDEPLSALDALKREDLQDVLLGLWKRRGHTQVLVTHSIEEAVFLGRRVVVMTPRPGRVAAIVENPEMGEAGYRDSELYHERCVQLRRVLSEEGAVHAAPPEGGAL
jgi:ABC-type nitrate/sulfonate/bicarbonate transport system ATPase subunit